MGSLAANLCFAFAAGAASQRATTLSRLMVKRLKLLEILAPVLAALGGY